jgi:hypothetical protein
MTVNGLEREVRWNVSAQLFGMEPLRRGPVLSITAFSIGEPSGWKLWTSIRR